MNKNEVTAPTVDGTDVVKSKEECQRADSKKLLYTVEDEPPWKITVFLSFQSFLMVFCGTLSVPYLLAPALCIPEGDISRGYLISTIIFVSGISTFIQTTFGIRLPMVQGGTFAFLIPTLAVLHSDRLKCPDANMTANLTVEEIWQPRMREVFLALMISWIVCAILTATNAIDADSPIRTDKMDAIYESPWIRVPYPGQWGMPTVYGSTVIVLFSSVLVGIVESIGNFIACAEFTESPLPPAHAINRAVAMEGIGCIIAGLFGSGNATTTYSDNIAVISVTKVASRRVTQVAALIMIIMSVFAKFGALFTTIPEPILGGMFLVMFGIISAVGLSILQNVDMSSSRNIFIVGLGLCLGIGVPAWFKSTNPEIDTGYQLLDDIIVILAQTSMFVGGLISFILDNTIPGTYKRSKSIQLDIEKAQEAMSTTTYDLPCGMKWMKSWKFSRYIPFCPMYYPKKSNFKRPKYWFSKKKSVGSTNHNQEITMI
ncbi:Solute carrier family 23 member 1 [Nymphon striatum]|nr:Solute carrier family 23 member 1 [Nymphon striatum]